MIRIKSITDVITNSSTEVYTYFDEDGLEKIKEIVNTIILVSEGHGTFDGYFEIGFVLAPGEDEVIKYLCENEEKPVPDDLLGFALEWNRETWKKKDKDVINLLPIIRAKSPEHETQAERLTECVRGIQKTDTFFVY